MKKRAFISIGLLISLLMMPITAILIHVTHENPESSHKWLHIHVGFGILFTVFGIFHGIYNWKALKRHLLGTK